MTIEEQYEEWKESEPDVTKEEFLMGHIFDFDTYDGDLDNFFCHLVVEVIEAILNRTTFDYIKDNYKNYIIMVNMPFLKNKIDWGTSIRGAWFDAEHKDLMNDIVNFYHNY